MWKDEVNLHMNILGMRAMPLALYLPGMYDGPLSCIDEQQCDCGGLGRGLQSPCFFNLLVRKVHPWTKRFFFKLVAMVIPGRRNIIANQLDC